MAPSLTAAPDPIRYLDDAAASEAGTAYKRRLLNALDIRPGHTVVDVGCGPGTDLATLAAAAGTGGLVIGVDRDPAMAAEAARRVSAASFPVGSAEPVGRVSASPLGVGDAESVGRVSALSPGVGDPEPAGRVSAVSFRVGNGEPAGRASAASPGVGHVKPAGWGPVTSIRVGDAEALPLADASIDRVRTDRVLQHVADPGSAIAEAYRVLRPGGLLGMAEPDWDTLAVADDDVETSRGFARFTAGQVRHATLGRQLVRLTARAGFTIRSVEAVPIVFRDFGLADRILGLTRNSARAVEAAQLREDVAGAWLARLSGAPFLAAVTIYLVTVTR